MVKRMNEFAAVEAFLSGFLHNYRGVDKGFMDDASAFRVGDLYVFFKVDGTSFKSSMYPWMGADDLIFRVAAGSVTDIVAKGGNPYGIAVSLGLPIDEGVEDLVKALGDGVADFLTTYGLRYMGGDMNSSDGDGWVDVAAVGMGRRFISNSPLNPGDEVLVSGCLGYSSVSALIHYRGLDREFLKYVIDKVRRPHVPLNFLEVEDVKASTDISDGLESLRKVLRLNGVGLRLYDEVPLCPEVSKITAEASLSKADVLRYLGEEFLIAYVGGGEGLPLGEIVNAEPGQVFYGGEAIAGGWDNFVGFIERPFAR